MSFAERERQFNDSIGGAIAGFAIAAVNADSAAKDAGLARTMELLERPNVDFKGAVNVIGVDQPLETRVSVPVVSVVRADPIVVDEAKITMDMTVSEHMENTFTAKSETESSFTASAGILYKASLGIKSRLSLEGSRKRSSDYTATTHAELTMRQAEPAEGLAKLIDQMNNFTQTAMEINAAIVQKQAKKAVEEDVIQDADQLPEALPEPEAPKDE